MTLAEKLQAAGKRATFEEPTVIADEKQELMGQGFIEKCFEATKKRIEARHQAVIDSLNGSINKDTLHKSYTEIQLQPEAQKRLEQYNAALLQENDSVEHRLAVLMTAFLRKRSIFSNKSDINNIITGDKTYDVLQISILAYCIHHKDMRQKDFERLEDAADALAFYTYQNEANPHKVISAFFARFHKKPADNEDKSSNPKTSLADILADIQTIIQRYQQAGVSEKLIRKALKRARKELEGKEQIHHGRETAESRSKETSGAIQ